MLLFYPKLRKSNLISSPFYTDFISECEKLADYVINIIETRE